MEDNRISPIQRLLDNPWVLLVLGIVIPIVSYTLWGLYEYMTLQRATLP